jgi:hypothetical protein
MKITARIFAVGCTAAVLLLATGLPTDGSVGVVSLGSTLADSTGPVCKGYRVVQPGTTVQNGQLIEFYSYWNGDSDGYDVWADLSLLDATTADPVAGTYVGDSSVVAGDSITVWPCYRFIHTISDANTHDDAAGITVAVTAFDSMIEDSTTDEAIKFCLSNDPPYPQENGTRIIGDANRFIERDGDTLYVVRNGDLLRVETIWHYSVEPFGIEADFSAVDDSFASGTVFYSGISEDGVADYCFWYKLNEQAHSGSEYPLPVQIVGFDGGCGRDSIVILLEMDNEGPAEVPLLDSLPPTVTAAELIVSGTAAEGMEDVLILLNQSVEYVAEVHASYDTLVFADTLTLTPGTNHIVAYGRDLVGNRSPASEEYLVELQNVPEFKRFVVVKPDSISCHGDSVLLVTYGSLIHFYSYWKLPPDLPAVDATLHADFSNLDTQEPTLAYGSWREDLDLIIGAGDSLETWHCYQFEHTLADENLRSDDDNIPVPVTAFDPTTGYSTTTETLLFCLSNDPPQHLWTKIIGDSARFVVRDADTLYLVRNGGSIYAQTSWSSNSSYLTLAADFGNVDAGFQEQWVDLWLIDSLSTDTIATYGVSYPFGIDACCAEGKDPYPLPVPIMVRDTGCGCGTVTLLLEMDNEGPAGSPSFAPAPPAAVDEASLTISGEAPEGSADVLIEITHAAMDSVTIVTLTVDGTRAFSGTVPLLAGSNLLVAYGRDIIGNRSDPSQECEVYRVAAPAFEIPKPFRRNDEFVFVNPDGWSSLMVEIYNLEGDLVWSRSHEEGPYVRLPVQWDGRNGAGENVRQGPYLLRIRHSDAGGRKAEEVRAFVYKR